MPELPEIETVKKTLEPLLSERMIISCQSLREDVIKHPEAESFRERIAGQTVGSIGRRGKFLLIHLTSGDDLISHLRMTGRMLYAPAEHPLPPHTHVIFQLDNGSQLRFADTRRFGCLWLKARGEEDDFTGIHRLGLEPFAADFGAAYLKERLHHRRIAIKQGLLDQSVIAGLGNIYVDEVLFAARINPARKTTDITDRQWQAIAQAIPEVLRASIANNGTTFSDYLDGEGRRGNNLPYLKAYKREGQPCGNCQTLLKKIKLAGRGTYFCPQCQR